jgi:hypothetical protein
MPTNKHSRVKIAEPAGEGQCVTLEAVGYAPRTVASRGQYRTQPSTFRHPEIGYWERGPPPLPSSLSACSGLSLRKRTK